MLQLGFRIQWKRGKIVVKGKLWHKIGKVTVKENSLTICLVCVYTQGYLSIFGLYKVKLTIYDAIIGTLWYPFVMFSKLYVMFQKLYVFISV